MSIDAALGRLGIQTGVCTSSTRPANPYEGQVIYETDTNKVLTWDGSAWLLLDQTPKGDDYTKIASGTTAERPVSPSAGMIRFNETTGEPEWYSSAKSNWVKFRSTPETILQFLVVGGGGGGGFDGGGGGGAGGYRSSVIGESSGGGSSAENTISVIPGTSYTVTVGAGGTAATSASGGQTVGGNSVFASITSLGGGWGANGIPGGPGPTGQVGGSGGGGAGRTAGVTHAGGAGTANQGYAGGSGIHISGKTSNGGGGGGASEVGANMVWTGSNPTPGGDGGDGVSSNIDGTPTYRAGGGGGGANNDAGNTGAGGTGGLGGGGNGVRSGTAGPGTANTGGGGGGGYRIGGAGAAGGSGVVIIRYEGDFPTISAGLTYVTSTIGSDTVLTFTAGTGTVTF